MKKVFGVVLALSCLLSAGAQDKEKKTYELIYRDVQLLKQQYQKLESMIGATSDEIKLVGGQVRDLAAQFKLFQTDQARSQEGLKNLPSQVQVFLERLGQIEGQLFKISQDLAELKAKPAPAYEPPQDPAKKPEKIPGARTAKEPQKKGESAAEKKEPGKVLPQTNLSPQDVFNTAYADYQKGNFDLAIDGFTIYREQFPASPLSDDALYMIGECYFSQKKYDKAIESFDDLNVNYPLSNRIAASYWKKALTLVELKKKDEAIAVLRLLITKYPLEDEAKSAQAKLKELQGVK
jgi:tol-pal system protein YbgF